MTLSTDLIILDPVPHLALFDRALEPLAAAVDFDPSWAHTDADPTRRFSPDAHYATACGQGLPASLWVWHADDAPLAYYDDDDIASYQDEVDGWTVPTWNQHLLRVNWDTAYNWSGPHGGGCSDLHAWLLRDLCGWLADRGVTRMWWRNEYTHTTHTPDEVETLGRPDLGNPVP